MDLSSKTVGVSKHAEESNDIGKVEEPATSREKQEIVEEQTTQREEKNDVEEHEKCVSQHQVLLPDPNNQTHHTRSEEIMEVSEKDDEKQMAKIEELVTKSLAAGTQNLTEDPNTDVPPLSPNELPVASPSFFIPKSELSSSFQMSFEEATSSTKHSFKPTFSASSFPAPTIVTLPSRPTIGPMPPPPPGKFLTHFLSEIKLKRSFD